MTHLVQVHHTHGNFAQTLSSVDIGFRCSSNTTTAKLRTDSILPRKSMSVQMRSGGVQMRQQTWKSVGKCQLYDSPDNFIRTYPFFIDWND